MIKKFKSFLTIICFMILVAAIPSFAHFQMVYTPNSIIDENTKSVPFLLVFTHPFEAGHTMDIGKDEKGSIKGMKDLIIVHKDKKTSAINELKKITFTSLENSGEGYTFTLDKKAGFKGSGDWILIAIPHPYYEGSEDIYIQQITKVMINKNEMWTDWDKRCADGYPEIIPLVKPYDVWVGGVFRGLVIDGDGKPVAGAEIEIEYMNYTVDINAKKFKGKAKTKVGATIIIADEQGNFSFAPHKAGYWGFAALGAGGEKTYNGKELSEDAVLWIEAMPIK